MDFRPSRFEILPVVVKNLLIINGLVFLATVVLGRQDIDITPFMALHHWQSNDFGIWQFITHLFMHGHVAGVNPDYEGGFMHLFSNMFALWMFGSLLENYFGSKRFLAFYLLCGVGAALFHLGVYSYELNTFQNAFMAFKANPTCKELSLFLTQYGSTMDSDFLRYLESLHRDWLDNPMNGSYGQTAITMLNQYQSAFVNQATVGASGAVFGILFAFGYLFPNTLIYLYFFFPIKAKYFVALYALFELYAGVRNSAGDQVAHFAHLGGMIIAFLVIKIWNKTHRSHFY
ncbi:MAG: rhomboid family intramembrane serine protease [Chitinophagaceae bacterium]